MSGEERDSLCECDAPYFVSHGGWWLCRNCRGWLPCLERVDAVAFMRERIAEGRASLARKAAPS